MNESVEEISSEIVSVVTVYGLDVVAAVAILIVGWIAAGWVQRAIDRGLEKTGRVELTLRLFLSSFGRYTIIVVTILAVLSRFGVQTASLITVLGAAGLAIGLALQGTLSNVAAGVMLLLFRPFKVGDYVEAAGLAGTVKSVSLFVTELSTPDNVQVLAPNSQVWGTSVKNYSHHATRRVDIVVGIGYDDSIDQAMTAIVDTIKADDRAHADPAPFIGVTDLGDNSVNLTVRVWCDAANYWPLKFDLTKKVKEQLDAAGITIPYPQRTVHLIQEKSS
jgi:small conductance mechanosensitive channel